MWSCRTRTAIRFVWYRHNTAVRQPSEAERKAWAERASDEYVYLSGQDIVGHARIDGSELAVVSVKLSRQSKGIGREFVRFLVNRVLENGEERPTLW